MHKSSKKNKEIKRENRQDKDKYNFVLYVPEITHDDWKIVNGEVLLNFKVVNPMTRFVGFLAKKEPIKDILFDDMCTSAWLSIDGERSIYEIAKIQFKMSDDDFKDDLRRLAVFIKYISKQGWVRYKRVKNREEIKYSL